MIDGEKDFRGRMEEIDMRLAEQNLQACIDNLTSVLLNKYGENTDWDGDPIDEVRSGIQDLQQKLLRRNTAT